MSNSGPGALELHCHEVTVRFVDHAVVPPYEGSMIRGAFGRAFKESCCPFPHDGNGCPLGDKWPYGYVFETSPPEGAREFAKNQEVPRPYVFEPPDGTKMGYAPGEKMRFGFTVVGRAADYMPYFIYAFSKNRKLPTVWENAVSAARKLEKQRVRLEFLTPAFVKFEGKVSPEAPSFPALVQALLIRIPMLSAVHCGEVWHEDFKGLVARAGEVETVRDETTWVTFRRYSSFKKSEPLEGVVGHAEYAGPVEEFLPLLEMGQLTHVGKRAVFGLGRYRMESA
jgi:hypothetical protein